MNRRIFMATSLGAPLAAALAQTPQLAVGMLAPDFTAKDQNGAEVALKDYLGKSAVALCFYPKALTGG